MATLWHSRAQQLLALRERAEMGGGARRMEKQKAAGKLSARERLELLRKKIPNIPFQMLLR